MKSIMTSIVGLGVVALGTATYASPVTFPISEALGQKTAALAIERVEEDLRDTFDRIDINKDGLVDENEFAAHAVVIAQLVRLNRAVAIGDEGYVELPAFVRRDVTDAERAAIDAMARTTFTRVTPDANGLTTDEFVDLKIQLAHDADLDRDGVLVAQELSHFALSVAQVAPAQS